MDKQAKRKLLRRLYQLHEISLLPADDPLQTAFNLVYIMEIAEDNEPELYFKLLQAQINATKKVLEDQIDAMINPQPSMS